MKKIIEKVREQPAHIKRHILHALTLGFGFILVLLWIYSLGTTLTSERMQAKVNQDLKPLSVLKSNVIDGYNSLSDINSDNTAQ